MFNNIIKQGDMNMEREAANIKYTWDLEGIYKDQKEWEKDYRYLLDNVKKIGEFKGKLNDKEMLKKFNKFSEEFSRISTNAYIYAYLGHDTSLKDVRFEDNLSRMHVLFAKLGQEEAFVAPEMASFSDSYLDELINDNDFKDYKLNYESIKMNRKHVLSEEQEVALATADEYSEGFREIYDALIETDANFESFVVDGKEYPMSREKYSNYVTNKNREVRIKAYQSLYKYYKDHAHTFAKLLSYQLKMCNSDMELRNYKSYLSGALEGSKIPENVYYNLIKQVNENVDIMKEYFSLLKKETEIDDFSFYDTYVSISSLDKKFDYETQKVIVKDALSVLGKEYQELLQEAYDNRWIDVYPSKTKSSGGYQYGSYDTHPYVFLNNTDDYSSMSTMAHELGHAMHSYYSNKYQPLATSGYAIFVAEVASTVNEILLNRYMVENSKNIDDKIFFIDQYIKNVKATVFRQTMFSEFEEKLHHLTQNHETLTLERMNNEYKNLLEKHFGGVVNIDENIIHEWIAISHFYRPFYVYKYATSFTTANYIASCILEDKNDMKNKYFELLKSGGSDWPNEILKKVGVDLESNSPYEMLFDNLKTYINELKKLLDLKRENENSKGR